MNYAEWLDGWERKTAALLPECFEDSSEGGWQENYITTRLLSTLKKTGADLVWNDAGQTTTWQAYKLRGACEETFGDIALLVRVHFSPTEFLDGVAFYEAKRAYYSPEGRPLGFSALRAEQLSAIHQSTHAGQVLLYEVERRPEEGLIGVATAIPTAFVKKLGQVGGGKKAAQLRSFGRPWTVCLGDNLRGFHLDFNPAAVSAIKLAAESLRPPPFLLQASISAVPGLKPQLDWYAPPGDYATWIEAPAPGTPGQSDEPEENGGRRNRFKP